MMKTLLIFSLALILATIFGCSNNASPDNVSLEFESNESAPFEQRDSEPIEISKKLIHTADIRFESEDLDSSKSLLLKAIENNSGFVSSEKAYKGSNEEEYVFQIRVPQSNFKNLLSEATAGVESFDRKSIQVEDVTEKFIDLEARLKTKKTLEKRYLELLKKSKSVSEILEVEKELNVLRADIESAEGRHKYLANQVSLSTINLSFYKRVSKSSHFGEKFTNGISNGWKNLMLFFVLLVNIWPFIIIAFGIFFGIRYYRRRRN